jgi:hypothetical protein
MAGNDARLKRREVAFDNVKIGAADAAMTLSSTFPGCK